jgi:DNA-binding XRE family transcriptional regulator
MISQQPKTISLQDFAKDFTPEQKKIVEAETRYYYLLTSFKEAREKKGMTQQELAHKAQVNRSTLSNVETGLRNATIGTLDKLAAAMDLKLDVRLRA